MTDCNRQPLSFSSLGSKSVVADFLGGRLTSDAGALLLREVGQKTGLFEALDQAIPDPRHPVYIVHDQESMIAQRIIAIALGYEDLNDHQTLRNDPALQVAAGRVPDDDLGWPRPQRSAAWKTASSDGPWSALPACSSISSLPRTRSRRSI